MDDLSQKIALVTGSSRGIGRACALALARAGADVVINYHRRERDAQEIVAEVRALGHRAIALQGDVSNASSVERMLSNMVEQLGAASILVNNAGIARPQPIAEITERDWDDVLTANLKSCFLVTQRVLPGMRTRHWGRIINLSSVAAHTGGVVGPHYAASKAGILGLTHSYANLLVKEGITCNAISPALIDTEMVAANLRATPDLIPVGRLGKVEEVADVVVMLARNGFITGQTIHVNGGWYMS
jgi:3-oxoacyl-[acyl-carrier protein] reductase